MTTLIIDATPGNLHSAEKAFQKMAADVGAGPVTVGSDPEAVLAADRLVLPGDGAFPAAMAALTTRPALIEAIVQSVTRNGRPLFGICVGMQLLATTGEEFSQTPGLGWIPGRISRITPSDPLLKVPHMGWNDLVVTGAHPVLDGIATGDHAYFVHSYQFVADHPGDVLAHADYGGPVTAVVGKGTVIGTQFHPEKSQSAGLRMIANFLRWRP